ncbi:SLAP domain-containing protein [Companilactobacillus huachuanensis]|uniref:SLAP domain-containing protein n=1 Tax=Companilactobacillus huachuanensis TaxID=2559914 RepID=A0ABW1RNZ6_9LACO|nr:SLAP domain-containing protein [Companilactobacillus huachuanensis]
MKKSKSLVITSLLFSTMILNPSVIQGVIVQADANNQVQVTNTQSTAETNHQEVNDAKTKMVTFHLLVENINGKTEVKNYQVATKPDQKTVTVSDLNEALHNFYKLAETDATKTYEIDSDKGEVKGEIVAFNSFIASTTREIVVKYLDSTNNSNKIADSSMIVKRDVSTVLGKDAPMPRGYVFSGTRPKVSISNNTVTIKVKPANKEQAHEVSKSDVIVKYVNDKDPKAKVADGVIKDVADNATSVSAELVTAPKGYKLVADQKFAVSYGKVTVHIVPAETATKEINVKYLDSTDNTKKFADGKMTVAKNTKKVARETVPLPDGYEISGRRLISIKNGQILVHIKPAKKVVTADTTKEITIKYLDSTNNMNKLADGKMTVDKHTKKVAHETVPLPAGYEVSARRLIVIKNGQILVHVKPIGWNAGHEVSKSDVTVKYVNDKNAKDKITDGVIKDVKDDATSVAAELVSVPKGYKLVADQKFAVSYGKVTVHVVPDTTKEITVKYLDSTDNTKKIADGKMTVDKHAKKVAHETVPLPEGYEISGRRLISIKNGHILAHIKPIGWNANHEAKKSDVTVKYVNDKNAKDKITDGVIKDVVDSATSVSAELVKAPKGYKLVADQKFAVSYGKVTVHVVPDTTKEITVKYLDSTNNMKKIPDGKMTVSKNAKKVAHETVPMPAGYQVSARRLIKIKKGQIFVHVKPIGWNAGHEVSKSDVNDKDTKVKIADGVIKDVKDDATSVAAELVTAPKGYTLVADQKFAVSYGRVIVHVVPENTTVKPAPAKPSKHSVATTYTTAVHFVDHKSGDKVHSTKIVGKHGQKHEVALPEKYDLAAGETNKISTDKKKQSISIKVIKKAVEGTITEHRTTLSVVGNAPLYSKEGKAMSDRALAHNSTWFTDKKLVVEGATYHRVSTNEWVKASDVYSFVTVNKTINTSAKTAKALYDTKGNIIKDRALAASSSWFADRSATINGKQMYRVATNEWVAASDLV